MKFKNLVFVLSLFATSSQSQAVLEEFFVAQPGGYTQARIIEDRLHYAQNLLLRSIPDEHADLVNTLRTLLIDISTVEDVPEGSLVTLVLEKQLLDQQIWFGALMTTITTIRTWNEYTAGLMAQYNYEHNYEPEMFAPQYRMNCITAHNTIRDIEAPVRNLQRISQLPDEALFAQGEGDNLRAQVRNLIGQSLGLAQQIEAVARGLLPEIPAELQAVEVPLNPDQ